MAKFRSSEVQKFRSSEDCADSTKLVNTYAAHKYKNIPAKLDKKAGVKDKIHFASADDFGIYGVNCKLASAVCARYYKGLSAHGDNLVIVKVE